MMDRHDKNFEMYCQYLSDVYDHLPITDEFVPWLDFDDGLTYGWTEPSITISREQYLEMLCTINRLAWQLDEMEKPAIRIPYEYQPKYCDHPSVHDLNFDEMVDEIENYIDFCKWVHDELPEFESSGEAHVGFAQKTETRCEMVCFEPDLDSIYCTTRTMYRLCKLYPEIELHQPLTHKLKFVGAIP
jgi:hypothetical protein